jgi:hypothetical protein
MGYSCNLKNDSIGVFGEVKSRRSLLNAFTVSPKLDCDFVTKCGYSGVVSVLALKQRPSITRSPGSTGPYSSIVNCFSGFSLPATQRPARETNVLTTGYTVSTV